MQFYLSSTYSSFIRFKYYLKPLALEHSRHYSKGIYFIYYRTTGRFKPLVLILSSKDKRQRSYVVLANISVPDI